LIEGNGMDGARYMSFSNSRDLTRVAQNELITAGALDSDIDLPRYAADGMR
jgi:hypothetical protein